ncbi:biopolymer transporter ExbD [Maricurvus nonylphenolicus]|uniref:ExbD/TolR family protein n=1 Tax=Maricurvus nonylphenolicus TaxID=1008307 RepID=UPI0036F3410A
MKFRRQSQVEDSINLTPLIDVVFLLLIFFMVSTTFTKETHLSVDLPEAEGAPSAEIAETIEILINADGSYAVNGQNLVNKKSTTLSSALEKTAGGNFAMPLIITADAKTPHQSVVTAMDVAGQLGFVKLSITTRNPQPET